MIKDSDLGGFNSNRFDIPLLAEELLRAGYDFDLSKHRTIDAQTIFHKMEPRNLSAAYQFYSRKISRKCTFCGSRYIGNLRSVWMLKSKNMQIYRMSIAALSGVFIP